jgi:superfamily II DNA or RNA helicase
MNKQALSVPQTAAKSPKQNQRKKNNAPKQNGKAQGHSHNQGKKKSTPAQQHQPQHLPKDPIPHIYPVWIKNQAKAGNWRRGLEMHLSGHKIMNLDLEPFGIVAQVKGNYKSHYTTEMRFNTAGIEPRCNCAIEEKWCKHAVAVALSIAEQRLWEVYWNLPEEEAELMPLNHPMGILKVQLHLAYNKSKGVGVRLIERERDAWCADPSKLLKRALTAQYPDGTPWHQVKEGRADIAVLQFLEQHRIKQVSNNGWLLVPFELFEPFFTTLSACEEVLDEKGLRLQVEEQPLMPLLEVSQNSNGQTTLAMHWSQFEATPSLGEPITTEKAKTVLALEELELLDPQATWGKHLQRIYPLQPVLAKLPKALKKSTFTDVPMQDSGSFLFEVLPNLRKLLLVDDTAVAESLKKMSQPPAPSLNVEMLDPAAMRLRLVLHFNYDKTRIPYAKQNKQTPYLASTNKKKNKTTWYKRDFAFEEKAYERVNQVSSQLMQAHALMSEGDEAVDLYNVYLPRWEKEGWIINMINPQDMTLLQASRHPLSIVARLEFDESVTFFTLKLEARLGQKSISMSEIQKHMVAGKKYFYVQGTGFVEVPLHTLLAVGRTIQAFEPEILEVDFYKIPTFKAGLLMELVDAKVTLDMSKKFQRFWEIMTAGKPMEELSVPANVEAELRPYQERGFQWLWFLYSYGLNGILADDMGLGKTLQALVALQQARNKHGQFPSLIVCPTTLVRNWQNEITRFTPELTVLDLTGSDRYDNYPKIKDADIVITSYAILRRDINAIKDYAFRFAILDESQQIKNFSSQTAQAAKKLQSQHRIALSGTPIENRLSELWSVFDFLMPGFLEDHDDFRRRYIQPIEERGSLDAGHRLKKQVSPFILRRMKRDVLKDLPPKMEQVLYCDLTDNQRQLYLDVLEKAREELMEEAISRGGKINQQHVFSALTKLRQVCNHPALLASELSGGVHESGKFELLKELLENAIANGHRILVFSQFVQMLKIMEKHLKKKGICYEILTGETKSEDRQNKVDRFNTDETIKIFLVSLKAGGTGLNLTGADMVVHYDPWWNPAAEDQATDRVHRIGQTKSVFVYRLIARSTVEERIMQLKSQKRDLVDSVISADRSITKKISLDDLKDILSLD